MLVKTVEKKYAYVRNVLGKQTHKILTGAETA